MSESLDSLARRVAERLLARGEKVAVAETSAGGLVNHALTDIAGSSKWYAGGAVPYTTVAKAALCGLDPEAVAAEGSVSAYTAREMARGIRGRLGAGWGIAETGIAGPQAGRRSPKPAGVTYLAVAGEVTGRAVEREREIATGASDRLANKEAFAAALLGLLLETIEAAG
jgi:PncC family amidohydrolase